MKSLRQILSDPTHLTQIHLTQILILMFLLMMRSSSKLMKNLKFVWKKKNNKKSQSKNITKKDLKILDLFQAKKNKKLILIIILLFIACLWQKKLQTSGNVKERKKVKNARVLQHMENPLIYALKFHQSDVKCTIVIIDFANSASIIIKKRYLLLIKSQTLHITDIQRLNQRIRSVFTILLKSNGQL